MKDIKHIRIYKHLVQVISEFKIRYNLTRSIREIDWFLWTYGKEFLQRGKKLGEALKIPSDTLIDEYAKNINNTAKYVIGDKALRKLLKSFPDNTNLADVWLKVVVINYFYSAGIIDTWKMANHIVKINAFDKKLSSGNLVEEIRVGHGIRKKKTNKEIDFYSFATKYCSEHLPEKYPIFDQYVRGMLFAYKRRDKFCRFTD